jgi:hypothetical protein
MREAKNRKREALGAVATIECGRVEFSGALFHGEHHVRLTCRDDNIDLIFMEVDGKMACAKTQRGVKALLMRRVAKAAFKQEGGTCPARTNNVPRGTMKGVKDEC